MKQAVVVSVGHAVSVEIAVVPQLRVPADVGHVIDLVVAQRAVAVVVDPGPHDHAPVDAAVHTLLGVGIGWMDAEFRALGLDRHARGRVSDETLDFFEACFAQDTVEANGQPFLFKPRPAKPPILIGGRAPYAIERAAKYGDGWFPVARTPKDVAAALPRYRELTAAAGKPPGQITASARLPLSDRAQASDLLDEYRGLGVDRLVCGVSYDTVKDYWAQLELLKIALD